MILQHWRPLNSKGKGGYDDGNGDDSDNDVEDEGHKAFKEFEKVAPFANPVQRKKKKGLDFRKWKEITQDDSSSLGKELEEEASSFSRTTQKKKNEEGSKNADKKTSSYAEDSVSTSMEVDAKPQLDNSNGVFIDSATATELDKVDHLEKVEYAVINNHKKEKEFVPGRDQICSDRMADHNSGSVDVLRPERNYLTSSMLSGSSFNNIRSEQGSMSLDSEIDAENRARIMQMSAEEIAEARTEVMERLNPALLKVLQKRGQEKLNKHSSLKSEVDTAAEAVNRHVESARAAKCLHTEDGISHTVMTPPSKKKLDDENVNAKTSTTTSSSSWNAWSSRVEAIRELRFSLDGDVVDAERGSVYGMPYLFFVCFFI